jgi:regulatory protein
MVVTELRRKGNYVYVNFDNDGKLTIPYDVFLKNYLSVDEEISEKKLKELELNVELYKIKQSSYRYLSGRNHSKYELKMKLLKKKYSKSLVGQVLNDLERQHLINDEDFARDYFNSQLRKSRGLLKIKSELFKKGVNREIIEKTSNDHGDAFVFLESAKSIAEKKYSILIKRNISDRKMEQKIYQFLASRGFTSDIIRETMNYLELENRNE